VQPEPMTSQPDPQIALDDANASFWDELCGTALARSIGATERSPESLARFDAAYFDYYPYLAQYVVREPLDDARVLEIGLGYGTLGQLIAERGADYHGLDIATGPVAMMRTRLGRLGLTDPDARVQVGSALEIPHADATFDYVYSIGCLHHTGDLAQSISEVHRVLRPGGRAVVMLYNGWSILHVAMPVARRVTRRFSGRSADVIKRLYDVDSGGEVAPHTDFTSPRAARELFGGFGDVHVDVRNFPDIRKGRIGIPRRWLLPNVARVVGVDLYIRADK
jgi:SAM-dependent methyltransferase